MLKKIHLYNIEYVLNTFLFRLLLSITKKSTISYVVLSIVHLENNPIPRFMIHVRYICNSLICTGIFSCQLTFGLFVLLITMVLQTIMYISPKLHVPISVDDLSKSTYAE